MSRITCNWCDKKLNPKCKYIWDHGLPKSCCNKCFTFFCKENGTPYWVDDEYFAWMSNEQYNKQLIEEDERRKHHLDEQWKTSQINLY